MAGRETIPIDLLGERSRRFNNTCGVRGYMTKRGPTGADHHPDRCTMTAPSPEWSRSPSSWPGRHEHHASEGQEWQQKR